MESAARSRSTFESEALRAEQSSHHSRQPKPRDVRTLIFVGIKSSVVALDVRTGEEVWRAKLKGSEFVTVLWDGEALVAANAGELFALDPETGMVLWHNPLKGMGMGLVSLASSRAPTHPGAVVPAAATTRNRAQAAAT
jgi:outer membrane protein assembly factor BamB